MLSTATLALDPAFQVGPVSPRFYSSFIEHLGRAVYDGLYCPGHPAADSRGFRQDVLDLIRPLGIPLVRYPGGNFVSGFRWEDSVGPRDQRPVRLDRAWRTLETNQIGLHEFDAWCKEFGASMMMAVNLGTRGIDDACNLLEYCNHPGGTYYSDLRKSHGADAPYSIKTWCLGNEMDGPWQIGHKTAEEYGRLACETARAMRKLDSSIELVASGSSYPEMPTFPQWEATVLDHVYDDVDYLSLHQYLGDTTHDLGDYLAKSLTTEHFIHSVVSTCDYIKAKKRSKKNMLLSFDEWNIWYHSVGKDDDYLAEHPWEQAPSLVEDIYTAADAVVFGSMLITLLRHADRVKIACMAQLVNVIAPIMTRTGGGCWRQTIFYPFLHASLYGRGTVLESVSKSGLYECSKYGDVPYLESVAVLSESEEEVTVFAVNRSLSEDMDLSLDLRGFSKGSLIEHLELRHDNRGAINTEKEERVRPSARKDSTFSAGSGSIILRPASWNTIRIKVR